MRIFIAIASIIALAGCPDPGAKACGDGACPAGLSCVADPLRSGASCTGFEASDGCRLCVLPTCGNGHVDPGEACDDGNNLSGDGCPADCSAPCGDGVVDSGEACDDGNTVSGDGCSANCSSRESCGTGVVDPGEECDDGNLVDGDGCSAACTSEAPTWTEIGTIPPARAFEAMAYDPVRDRMVVFGGCAGSPCVSQLLQDTWEWDGTLWRQRAAVPTAPPKRMLTAIAYDLARHKLVMFGGCGAIGGGLCDVGLGDTWEWDGSSWVQQHPVGTPQARWAHAMAYDSARQRVVMYGGCSGGTLTCDAGNSLSDIWEWDGTNWSLIGPTGPPRRSRHALSYDPVRGVVVMFGGTDGATTFNDTWEWDGMVWRRMSTSGPPARFGHVLAYDAARGRTVLFAGNTAPIGATPPGTTLQDLWEWDGSSWTNVTPAFRPPPRDSAGGAFDTLRSRLVVLGGRDANDNAYGDIWQWDGSAWRVRGGTPLPPARTSAGMAFDPIVQRMVMFGGTPAGGFAIGDTWEWDGSVWTEQVSGPAQRTGVAMAYDSTRGVTLMFGGSLGTGATDETWQWNGTWTQLAPAHRPPVRMQAAVAFDSNRGKLVLFGGMDNINTITYLGDTWEFDGTDWTQLTPATAPPARFAHAMAFDSARGKVVLYGGQSSLTYSPTDFADTWEWDGTNWTQHTPATSPPPHTGHAMAYDAAHGVTVLFGGCTAVDTNGSYTMIANDLWTWDGTTWTAHTPAVRPPARIFHAMAYDSIRNTVVMTTGASGVATLPYQDTWEWDGTSWAQRSGPTAPPMGVNATMAYDSARGQTVMFSGAIWEWDGESWSVRSPTVVPLVLGPMAYDSARKRVVMVGGQTFALSETWEWDGTNWTMATPANKPPARLMEAMAYDAGHGETVLFGGFDAAPSSDTWLWDGANWRLARPAISPAPRDAAVMAYDAARGVVVLFGGATSTDVVYGDTWEWDGTTWTQRAMGGTSPPPGKGKAMVYDAALRRVILLGGKNIDLDAWEWDGSAWTSIAASAAPSQRDGFGAAYDAAHEQVVVFGGQSNEGVENETWLFQFASSQPELVCRTGLDLAGAPLASCSSPDCAGACAACGDGVCDPVESCRECPDDCGACHECGDLLCSGGETCASCPGDCGVCP